MTYIKQKRFLKHILAGLVFLLSLVMFNSGKLAPVQAAGYTCAPQKTACCQIFHAANDPNKSVGVEDCKPGYNVISSNGGPVTHPLVGHCYAVQDGGNFGPLYSDADCANDPFNVRAKTPIDCTANVLNKDNCGIINYVIIFINVLSALVGVVIVAVIIIAGIQYSAAGNDPQKIAAAKGRIINALIALVSFIFMYAFLQWVVPGGVL